VENLDALRQAVAVSPENVPLLNLLAAACLKAGLGEEAQTHFARVLELDPSQIEAEVGTIEAVRRQGKGSEAVVRAESLCERLPGEGRGWLLRAKLDLAEGAAGAARRWYSKALELDRGLADIALSNEIADAGAPVSEDAKPAPIASGGANAFGMLPPGESMPPTTTSDFGESYRENVDVDFKDVGGMESVKEEIRMKILFPLQNRELFEAYGKKAGGGVLLYGPPGCGKTLISRATAGEIDASFFSIGLHQVMDMWMGQSEQKLHEIFEMARRQRPAVLFFDEIDALAADRRDLRTSAGRTLINQFLAELDGDIAKNDDVLILGATNAPWHLDAAFLRPGRFDRIVFVPPPDCEARAAIVEVMAREKPMTDLDPLAVAKKTEGFSGADLMAVFDQAVDAALEQAMKKGKIVPVTTKDLIRARKSVKPSTKKWFESAKNYALYANQGGLYDEILEYLDIRQ